MGIRKEGQSMENVLLRTFTLRRAEMNANYAVAGNFLEMGRVIRAFYEEN